MEDHATKKVKLTDDRNPENSRYTHLIETMGEELFQKVQSSKVLVVGAGGIGCELLKNLVLSGFKDIEIVSLINGRNSQIPKIDLDTIDLSNLNRQFLFQRQHIGKSKSQVPTAHTEISNQIQVAKESALRFNPDVNIIAHHGNVKNHDFGPDYFKKFTLVMNALDNLGTSFSPSFISFIRCSPSRQPSLHRYRTTSHRKWNRWLSRTSPSHLTRHHRMLRMLS